MRGKKIPRVAVETALDRICARLDDIVSQRGVVGFTYNYTPGHRLLDERLPVEKFKPKGQSHFWPCPCFSTGRIPRMAEGYRPAFYLLLES